MTMISVTSVLCALVGIASAQAPLPAEIPSTPLSVGKVFTFLFLTLGPFKVIGPFAEMTHERDAAFTRKLALRGTLVAALGLLAAATIGASTLRNWGVSAGALQLTAGIVLFLVALKPVLEQYEPREAPSQAAGPGAVPAAVPASKLAIVPLAFPTIVTPWGVAVLILLVTLRPDHWAVVLGVTVAVLVLDLLAMLSAERIHRMPFVATALAIVGMVLGILQVALGVQAIVSALPMLGLTGGVNG